MMNFEQLVMAGQKHCASWIRRLNALYFLYTEGWIDDKQMEALLGDIQTLIPERTDTASFLFETTSPTHLRGLDQRMKSAARMEKMLLQMPEWVDLAMEIEQEKGWRLFVSKGRPCMKLVFENALNFLSLLDPDFFPSASSEMVEAILKTPGLKEALILAHEHPFESESMQALSQQGITAALTILNAKLDPADSGLQTESVIPNELTDQTDTLQQKSLELDPAKTEERKRHFMQLASGLNREEQDKWLQKDAARLIQYLS